MCADISELRKVTREIEQNIAAALRAIEDVYGVTVNGVSIDRAARTVLHPDGEIFDVSVDVCV